MTSESVTVRTPAKLNLHLEVVGRRDDGYHDLSTVMHAIDLYDEITLRVNPDPDVLERANRLPSRREGASWRVESWSIQR